MRALAAVVTAVATLALAGCSGTEPHSPVDPEEAAPSDYVVPAVTFGVAAVTGLVLLGVVVLRRRRRRHATHGDAAAPIPGKGKAP